VFSLCRLYKEASISTRILGPDPTTFEAHSGPDQVLGKCWRRPYTEGGGEEGN